MAQSHWTVDFVFDTSSVRRLASLPRNTFAKMVRTVRHHKLRGGWIPWTMGEVAGRNLYVKELTRSLLSELQTGASRFDKLAGRTMLEELDIYCRRDAYRIAGITPPNPSPEGKWQRRRGLDHFLKLREPSQVTIVAGSPMLVVYRDPNGRPAWRFEIPTHFSTQAEGHIEAWRRRIAELNNRKLEEIVRETTDWVVPWMRSTMERLKLPPEVWTALTDPGNYEDLMSSTWGAGLVEAMYYARRAHGIKGSTRENDGADIYIGSYLFVATILVTDDGGLAAFAKSLFDDERRVMSCAGFMDWLDGSQGATEGEGGQHG